MKKLLHVPMADPFSCHVFEVNEYPTDREDFAMLDSDCDVDDFLTEVLNPNGDSMLLGFDATKKDVKFIEKYYAPGIHRLK
jgi:hypothetical protein